MLAALGAVREGREYLQPLGEVANRLEMSRALDSTLAGPLPVGDGLREKPRLGVVMRQQFGLLVNDGGKLRFEH